MVNHIPTLCELAGIAPNQTHTIVMLLTAVAIYSYIQGFCVR